MSKILFIKRVPLSTFYKRRISRIFPVFFIYLSVICLLSYLFSLSNEHENYLYSLFYIRSYLPVEPTLWHTGIPIGHLWSLNVEEHFYILLSVITLLAFLKGREYILLILLGVASICLQYFYVKYPHLASLNYEIKTEIVVSHLLISSGYFLIKHRFEKYVFSWLPVIAFILALFCYSHLAPWYCCWLFSPFLLAFSINHLDKSPKWILMFLSFKPLQLLGVWSYSIYLWQQPFYYYGVKFGEAFPYSGIIMLFSAIGVGALSFYYIENPIRKYLNNKW